MYHFTGEIINYVRLSKNINLADVPATINKDEVAELQAKIPAVANDIDTICAALQRPYPDRHAATLLLLDEAGLLSVKE